MKVCVSGLGQVGLPTALYTASRGLEVFGYDISEKAVARAKKSGISASEKWADVPPADVYMICVSTSLKNNEPDLTSIFDVCEKITEKTESALVSIESTVIPGTCRKISESIFKGHIALVHVPHRYWVREPVRHGVKQLRVIGGVDGISLKRGLSFYRDRLKIPLYIASSIEVAEMAKIVENAYRYLQIAFAEGLKMTCNELEVKFEEVRKACNTKWNVEILEARKGIGGHCLPKDIRFLISISPHNAILKSALSVDNAYREWLVDKKLHLANNH